jgi:hypothetical protein
VLVTINIKRDEFHALQQLQCRYNDAPLNKNYALRGIVEKLIAEYNDMHAIEKLLTNRIADCF